MVAMLLSHPPDGHDSVCGEEGLLHAVAMVHIDVQIQHPAGRKAGRQEGGK
jgi:hypothetical protein